MDLVIKNKADKFTDKVIMTDKISTEAIKYGLYIHNWYNYLTIKKDLLLMSVLVDIPIR